MRTHLAICLCLLASMFAARARAAETSAEIAGLRAEAAISVRKISDSAEAQIADIQAKIQIARTGIGAKPSSAAELGGLFQAPDCKEADRSLLAPTRKNGKILRTLDVRSDEYEAQDAKHKACVEAYIQQALAEIRQIESAAKTQLKAIVDEVNSRAEKAAAASGAAGVSLNGRIASGVEGVTVEGERPRRSQDTPKGEGDPDVIVCRTPQPLADSRLPGPEICKRNRDWAALYKAGMDISSDGRSMVPSEKQRTTKGALNCVHSTTGGKYEEHITTEICF